MAWVKPQYTRSQVDSAGAALVSSEISEDELDSALTIINNWRSSHSFPLNTFQNNLRRHSKIVDPNCLIAQRIKRLSSIKLKLEHFPTMKLSQMQDIGGCRAIVQDVEKVIELVENYKNTGFKHKLDHIDDYIEKPRTSGYRSVHLIYRYYSDKNETYNGLKIEMQIRSQLQHAWATAVETVGTFIRQALKSSIGEKDWLRFFSIMGTAISFREETPPVINTPTNEKELLEELRRYEQKLSVVNRLEAYGDALKVVEPESGNYHYFLLQLEPNNKRITVYGFKPNQLVQATKKYLDIESAVSSQQGSDAVLVSVESLDLLKRAYPNYFLDTKLFIDIVRETLSQ